MSEEDRVNEVAAEGIEAAIHAAAIGIVSGSDQYLFKGLGSGTLVRWGGRCLILTAEHVVRDTRPEDYRFFLPVGAPRSADRDEILSLPGVPTSGLLPASSLSLQRIVMDAAIDIAALEVDEELDGKHPLASFFDLVPGGKTPADGQTIIGKGFPRDLMRLTQDDIGVVFSYLEWTTVQRDEALSGFDPSKHFLAPFAQTDPRAHPLGLSGSAMWFRKGLTPEVWHSNIDVAGLTVTFYKKERLNKMLRREVIEDFLEKSF